MMFHSKVPHQLWVEAFFTSNFLGNLLPSSALPDHKCPYELLYDKPPVYTSLRVFGCSCYPYLRPYATNKFDPKSLHCVFLGYNDKYKGYRCLHPPSGKVYISRHVLFDETRFPYSDEYKSFLPSLSTSLLSTWQSGFLKGTHASSSAGPSKTVTISSSPTLDSIVPTAPEKG